MRDEIITIPSNCPPTLMAYLHSVYKTVLASYCSFGRKRLAMMNWGKADVMTQGSLCYNSLGNTDQEPR